MEKANTRTIFIEACNRIASLLDDKGFKILQKGQLLKKVSINKDLYYEIYFQSSFRNSDWDITITPHINIYSKSLKEWMVEQTKNTYETGFIYSNTLGYVSHYAEYKTWNIAGMSGEAAISEIADSINKYALPIFSLFDNIELAIEFMKENCTKFNKFTDKSLLPLSFMIFHAGKEDAEAFFNNYVSNCSYKKRIISLYKELEKVENIDLNHSEFVYANQVKLAFINGLEIHTISTEDKYSKLKNE